MRRIAIVAPLLLLLLVACGGPPDGASRFADERRFRVELEAAVPVAEGVKRLRLWLPVPAEDPYQEVTIASLEGPGEAQVGREGVHGNRFAYWEVEDPPERVVLRAAFLVRRLEAANPPREGAPRPAPDGRPPSAVYLASNRLVPLDGPVAAFARAAVKGEREDPLRKGYGLYRAVVSGMDYDKEAPGWGRGDARRACDLRRGNCTDFHALFIGGARSLGIPARFIMGYPLGADPEGSMAGYHCWAEFHVEGLGWVPVDASEARKRPELARALFGGLDPDRFSLTRGRDLVLEPAQDGPPLNFLSGAYAEADGTPVVLPKPVVRYRDLASAGDR